jgi:hypothetical protein
MPRSEDVTERATGLEELPIVFLDDSDVDMADGFFDSDGEDMGPLNLSTISLGCNCAKCQCGC